MKYKDSIKQLNKRNETKSILLKFKCRENKTYLLKDKCYQCHVTKSRYLRVYQKHSSNKEYFKKVTTGIVAVQRLMRKKLVGIYGSLFVLCLLFFCKSKLGLKLKVYFKKNRILLHILLCNLPLFCIGICCRRFSHINNGRFTVLFVIFAD